MKRTTVYAGFSLLLCLCIAVSALSGCGAQGASCQTEATQADSAASSDTAAESPSEAPAEPVEEPVVEDTSPLYTLTVTPVQEIYPDFRDLHAMQDHRQSLLDALQGPVSYTRNYTHQGLAIIEFDETGYDFVNPRFERLNTPNLHLMGSANGYSLYMGTYPFDTDQHFEIWDQNGDVIFSNADQPNLDPYQGMAGSSSLNGNCDHLIAEGLLPCRDLETEDSGFIRCSDGEFLTLDREYILGRTNNALRYFHTATYFSEGLCPVMYRSMDNCTHFRITNQMWDYEAHYAGFVDHDLNLVLDFSKLPQFDEYYINAVTPFRNGECIVCGRPKSLAVRETTDSAANLYGWVYYFWRIDREGNILENFTESNMGYGYEDVMQNFTKGYPIDYTSRDRLNDPNKHTNDPGLVSVDRLEIAPGLFLHRNALVDDIYGNRYDLGLKNNMSRFVQLDNGLLFVYDAEDSYSSGWSPALSTILENFYYIQIDPIDPARVAALPGSDSFTYGNTQG